MDKDEIVTDVGDEEIVEGGEGEQTPEPNAADEAAAAAAAASAGAKTSVLDAINESLEATNAPKKITPKSETPEGEDELDEDGTPRERNADGTFKAKEGEAAPKEGDPKPGEKKADAVNDPVPENIPKRTGDRMRELIDIVKQQRTAIEAHDSLFNQIQGTGASPEEFSTMVTYLRAAKSGDPQHLEAAYKILKSELEGIAIAFGKPIPEVNLLRDDANKDLVDEVRAGSLTIARAHELALQRKATAVRSARATRDTQTQQTTETRKADEQFGIADLDKLEGELIAKEGEAAYRAKDAMMAPFFEIIKSINPRQWRSQYMAAYNRLKAPAPVAAKPVVAAKPAAVVPTKQYPTRPKQPAGGGSGGGAPSKEPKSALEAINASLEG